MCYITFRIYSILCFVFLLLLLLMQTSRPGTEHINLYEEKKKNKNKTHFKKDEKKNNFEFGTHLFH